MDAPLSRKVRKLESALQELDGVDKKFSGQSFECLSNAYFKSFGQQVHYLDASKSTALVSGRHLDSLTKSADKHASDNIKLRSEVNSLTVNSEVARISLEQWKAKCKQLIQSCDKFYQLTNKQQLDIQELQSRLKQKEYQLENAVLIHREVLVQPLQQLVNQICTSNSQSTQTEYWTPKLTLSQHTVVREDPLARQNQTQQKIDYLITNLEEDIGQMTKHLDAKMKAIEGQYLGIQEYIIRNNFLKAQNQQLKQQIHQLNTEQEKLRMWKVEVQDKMESLTRLNQPMQAPLAICSISTQHQSQSQTQVLVHNQFLRKQVQSLRDSLLNKSIQLGAEKLKAKIRDQSLQNAPQHQVQPGQIQEEPSSVDRTVKSLSELSGKLKVLVTYLVSQP